MHVLLLQPCHFFFELTKEKPGTKVLLGLIIAASILFIFYTGIRAAIASFIILFIIICKPIERKKIKFFVFAIFCFISFFLYLNISKSESASGRLLIWKISSKGITENLLLGNGTGSFISNYPLLQSNYFCLKERPDSEILRADLPNTPFNEFLYLLFEQGIIGFLLFCLFIYTVLIKPYTVKKDLCYKVSMIAILINCFFSYPLHSGPISMLFFFNAAILASKCKVLWKFENFNSLLFNFLICILSFLFLIRIHNYGSKVLLWNKLKYFDETDEIAQSQAFNSLYPYLKGNVYFLLDYGNYLSSIQNIKAFELFESLKVKYNHYDLYIKLGDEYLQHNKIALAMDNYKTASCIIPNKIYPRYQIVNILIKENRIAEAIFLTKKILTTKDKIPSSRAKFIRAKLKIFLDGHKTGMEIK